MNHYPHHIGDFNSATRHLTRVERSLYRDLIDLYYDTEKPLNSDPVKIGRRVLAVSEEEKCALNLVLEEFFVLQDDGWHNTRCDAEIAKIFKAREDGHRWSGIPQETRTALEAERRAAKVNATPLWLTVDQKRISKLIYADAKRMTKETGIAHEVDHIVPLVSPCVCGLHVHWNLAVITSEKNRRKGNRS